MLDVIDTAKYRVREILRIYPQARDNDTVLYFLYAKLHTRLMNPNVLTPNQFANKVLASSMPSSESLSRARRLIQNNEGLYHGKFQSRRKQAADATRAGIHAI